MPAVTFLQKQPRHSISPCRLALSPCLPVPASSPLWTVCQFSAFHCPPVSQGKPGPKAEGSYSEDPCWLACFTASSAAFLLEGFYTNPRGVGWGEPPATPWAGVQGKGDSASRHISCICSMSSWLYSTASYTHFPQGGREANRGQNPKTKTQAPVSPLPNQSDMQELDWLAVCLSSFFPEFVSPGYSSYCSFSLTFRDFWIDFYCCLKSTAQGLGLIVLF